MKLPALVKLEMLVANKEATLLETLEQHDKALHHFDTQRRVLADYQARMAASWRNGAMIPAGDAVRAAKFAAQAAAARQHLAQSIETEQEKRTMCATELAMLRVRHETLQERLKAARQAVANEAQQRAERNHPPPHKPGRTGDSLF